MSYQVDSYGNVYFPAGVSVASIPATTGTQARVLVPGANGRISSATVAQLITQSGGNLVSSVFGRTGVVVAKEGDYTTDQITESGGALYFSTSRVRKSIFLTTFNTSGPATYDTNTGILNIPQYGSGSASPTNFVPLTRTITINGQIADLSVDRIFSVASMVYPSAGIALSNGVSWEPSITNNSANWNTAFSWGNHAGLYSLLGHTHTFSSLTYKPTTLIGYGITDAATSTQGTKADTAYSWGNHAIAGYLTSFAETDPTVASYIKAITTTNIANWNSAYSWGNHGLVGYLTSFTETDPIWTLEKINYYTKLQADARYLQSYTETDPIWTSEKVNYALKTYVDNSISNLVASAPAALNTLNELALALGSDANFSTTITTLIGTKEPAIIAGTTLQYFRGDKTFQTLPIYTLAGLGGQAQLNGTGFVKASGTTITYDNSTYYLASNPTGYITGISFANVSAKPTTIAGYGITDNLVYTSSTYSNPSWITALAWSKITGAPAFITGYTEVDTLASITGRGATTSIPITVTASEGREVSVYMASSYTTNDLVSGHEYGWYDDHWRLGMTRSSGVAGADFVIQWNAARRLSLSNSGNLTVTGTINASNLSGTNTGDQTLPTLSSLGGQPQLNGTGFVKATGTTISYDNSTYQIVGAIHYVGTTSIANNRVSASQTLTGVSIDGNAATVTNATFYRQFTVRDDRSDGSDYSLAARATGLYAINSAGTNGPGYGYLSLIHVSNGSDVAFQIAGGYNSDAMYFRGTYALQNGTGYSAWRTVIHSGNIASQTVTYATGETLATVTGRSAITSTAVIINNNLAVNTTSPFATSVYSLDINGGLLVKNTGRASNITLINADPAGTGNNAFVIHTVSGTLGSSLVDIQGYYGANITGSTTIRLNPLGGNVTINGYTVYHSGNIPTFNQNTTGTASSISGFNNPTVGATANTIAYRDGGGDLYARYFLGAYVNTSDNIETSTITYIMAKFGDNYHRSATAAKVQTFLGLGSLAYSSATIPTNNNQLSNGSGYITSSSLSSYLPLVGGTMTGIITTPVGTSMYLGGQNVSTSSRIIINWHNDSDYNYLIGKRAGVWTQPMDISFYTGIRYHAHVAYGGHKFYVYGYDNTEALSIGNSDSNVRVAYNLYIGSASGWITDLLNAKQNASTAITTSNYNSYSPTLIGGNASGTWSISINGNAATASNITAYTINQSVGSGNAPTFAGLTVSGPVYQGLSNQGVISLLSDVVVSQTNNYFRLYLPQGYYDNRNGGTATIKIVWGMLHAGITYSQEYKLTFGTNHGAGGNYLHSSQVTKTYSDQNPESYGGYLMDQTPSVDFYHDMSGGYINFNVKGVQSYNTHRVVAVDIVGGGVGTPTLTYYGTSSPGGTALTVKDIPYATTAGSANSVAWTNVSSRPTALSSFTNDVALPLNGNWVGNTGMNDQKLYLRTNGDNNHYLWNNASDFEEMVYYNGTGFKVTSSTGITTCLFESVASSGMLFIGSSDVGRTYIGDATRSGIAIGGTQYPQLILNGVGGTNPTHGANISMTGTLSAGGFRRWVMGIGNYDPTVFSLGWYDNQTNPHYGVGVAWGSPSAKYSWDTSGNFIATGDITAYGTPSDLRLKNIKEKVPNALSSIIKLNGYRFDWKEDKNKLFVLKEDIGVIAQEVAEIFPELARINEDGFMSVRYQGLTAVLIEGMKEQQAQIEEMKNEIKELKNK